MEHSHNTHDHDPHDLGQLTQSLARLADHLTDAAATTQTSTTAGGTPADAPPSDGVRERQAIHAAGAILAATDRLMAAVVGLLGHTTHRGVIAAEGVTTGTWLRVFAGRTVGDEKILTATVGDEKILTATVERLADMPAVRAWFTDGTMSWPTVRGIVAATRNLTGDQRRWLDDTLAADRHRVCRLDADQIVAGHLAGRHSGRARPSMLVVTDAATLARDTTTDTNRAASGHGGGAAGNGRVTPDGWSSTAQLLWNTHRPPVELTASFQRIATTPQQRRATTPRPRPPALLTHHHHPQHRNADAATPPPRRRSACA